MPATSQSSTMSRLDMACSVDRRMRSDGLRKPGAFDRSEPVGGNFFETVPPGGDDCVPSRVPHNKDDARRQTLLTNCHEVMEADATPLILKHLIPGESGDDHAATAQGLALAHARKVSMMALFGGRERTWEDFGSLLATAGFGLLPTRHPLPSDIILPIGRRR
jgi:hypothetical protein